ncbi:asparagine synthase-related protein [Mangrovimonas sp. AS39]|uniref:asparagine synthase-related protein n=1 Tax=Mangrovimonas futianensis TaxID=2895523 RepID=UPI001E43DCC8|nr:asparagine synthase-related protein [Mangrovimonas futianensis]MCF1191227.1 asparagine synthase-related protein [Mangrovimonas futianensis]MCF1194922.1 asparagine synthase-related protein [Mangrovimonas futianensis]
MTKITTPIIPSIQTYAKVQAPHELHLEAICVFSAIGFFLDRDTYWKDEVVLPPGCHHQLDETGHVVTSEPYFNWHYTPNSSLTFDRALSQFTTLFEQIVEEQTKNKRVILPLSGGLDSRTQAVALHQLGAKVKSYSYEFEGGYHETAIAKQVAGACGFDFEAFKISKGYLWGCIDTLAALNHCETDFTAPRQMAVMEQLGAMGDLFSLGHWGDVLFDDVGVEDHLSFDDQVAVVIKKLLKKGGLELAENLWKSWQLEGDFYDYFHERIKNLLKQIDIPNSANAQIRAFKSTYWAPRWTSVNLGLFKDKQPITLPYYDNRMCEWICTVPESILAQRQLQIAYIKKRAPKLGRITWQDQRPYNLYNYTKNTPTNNWPYKAFQKVKRTMKTLVGQPYIQRNWELQFLGERNREQLESCLFEKAFQEWVPKTLIETKVAHFYNQPQAQTAHPINMLLVLAKFNQQNTSIGAA